jgi:hypothetical protein
MSDWLGLLTAFSLAAASIAAQSQTQAPADGKPKPTQDLAVRGCLEGTTLTQIEPHTPPLELPEKLKVASLKVIRDQVKALDGHRVELTGILHGVPGVENGALVSDSDKMKVYVGGGDSTLGEDQDMLRNERPTMHARTIKDLAPACAADRTPREPSETRGDPLAPAP